MAIRFISIDDHPVISEAIGRAAERFDDVEMIGTFTSIESVPKPMRSPEACDVAVLDLSLPGSGGLEGVRIVRGWGVNVLVFSAASNARHAEQSLAAGATGFVSKSAATAQVLDAVRAVADGRRVTIGLESEEPPRAGLTRADRRLLDALTIDTRSRALGQRLDLSVGTVDNMIAQLYWKVGLDGPRRSRAALRDWARANGHGAPVVPGQPPPGA